MAGDLPDWVRQVQVVGGSVTIAGTATVTISGTPSVTVASGSVAINNTPSVTVASGSVAISNTPSVTIASGTVNATISGAVTITSGTVTVTEVQQNVVVDHLGSASVPQAGPNVTNLQVTGTASHQYQGIEVQLDDMHTTGGVGRVLFLVSVSNSTQGIGAQPIAAAVNVHSGGGTSLFVPVPADNGDSIVVNVTTVSGATFAGLSLSVFGLGLIPPTAGALRPDGRARPNATSVSGVEATANATVIAAPGTTQRILLQSLMIGGGIIGSGAAIAVVRGVIGGTTADLAVASCSAAGGGQGTALVWPDGLLLDYNSALTFVALVGTASQPFVVSAVYDIVN